MKVVLTASSALLILALGSASPTYPPAQPLFQEGVCEPAGRSAGAVAGPIDAPHGLGVAVLEIAAGEEPSGCAPSWRHHAGQVSAAAPRRARMAAFGADALRDLLTLTPLLPGEDPPARVALAGWQPRWRYVWPRDSAHVAAALASSGDIGRATEVYRFLASVQRHDGTFAARIDVNREPPDDRGDQAEAVGWYVWGFAHLLDSVPEGEATAQALWSEFAPSLHRAGAALLAMTESGLPPPSSDYWEREEDDLTLATAALTLSGLTALADLTESGLPLTAADRDLAAAARERAKALRSHIEYYFGPDYGRYGARSAPDAALAFLLPPYQSEALTGAEDAWWASLSRQQIAHTRGYSPGATWRRDGVVWTPETTAHALVAAHLAIRHAGTPAGQRARGFALDTLAWVEAHTTAVGAIPEKVAPGGTPSAVAPLAWSAANAVLALHALDLPPQAPGTAP